MTSRAAIPYWYGILSDHHSLAVMEIPATPATPKATGIMMDYEEKWMDLEVRLARQEDLIDTLNTQVYRQQKKIDELEGLCKLLAGRMQELALQAGQRQQPVDERPPHY